MPVLVVQLSEPHCERSQAQKGTCSATEKAEEGFLQHLVTLTALWGFSFLLRLYTFTFEPALPLERFFFPSPDLNSLICFPLLCPTIAAKGK